MYVKMFNPRPAIIAPTHTTPKADKRAAAPIDDIARALGCDPGDTRRFKEALYDLCKKCVIRYGLPDLVRDELGDALGVRKSRSLRYPPEGERIDTRWARLAQALQLPKKGHLPLISLAEVTPSAVQAICAGTMELVHEFKSGRLSGINGPLAGHLRGASSRVRALGEDCGEGVRNITRPIAHGAARQLEIYHEVGESWTLVSPEEQVALLSCARAPAGTPQREGKPSGVVRTDRSAKPSEELLRPLGLKWMWKEARQCWEPQIPHTDKPKASLFDHSTMYLEIQIERLRGARTSSTEGMLSFLRSLNDARHRFQMDRAEHPTRAKQLEADLHYQQNRNLDRHLDRFASGM